MDTGSLPQTYKPRRYTPPGIDTIVVRIRFDDIPTRSTHVPVIGTGWKADDPRPGRNGIGWTTKHRGLDITVDGWFRASGGPSTDGRIDITLSIATIYTWLETGIALNLLPAPIDTAKAIITTIVKFVIVEGCGLRVGKIQGLPVIQLDPFVDVWPQDTRGFVDALRQLPPRVRFTKAKEVIEYSDPAAERMGTSGFDVLVNSLYEARKGSSKKAAQGNRAYDRQTKVMKRMEKIFALSKREELLSDANFVAYIEGQIRFEAVHGNGTINGCRLPLPGPEDNYTTGGASRFKGEGVTVGALQASLLRAILVGRLREKGISGGTGSLVTAPGDYEFLKEIRDAGGTKCQASYALVIGRIGTEKAKLLGFNPRRFLSKLNRDTGRSFVLAQPSQGLDSGKLLDDGCNARNEVPSKYEPWRVIPELRLDLGGAIPGMKKRRRRKQKLILPTNGAITNLGFDDVEPTVDNSPLVVDGFPIDDGWKTGFLGA